MNEKRGILLAGGLRTLRAIPCAAVLHLLMFGKTLARPGDLDTTFGTDGMVTIDFLEYSDQSARGVAIQSDGKILLGGEAVYCDAVARFDSNGQLDSTFGVGGKLLRLVNGGTSAMALVANDKFITAGNSHLDGGGYIYFSLRRYNRDGSVDTTFGSGGTVNTYMGDYAGPQDAVVQKDGKIVLAGFSQQGANRNFALARYNPDGLLDPSFGNVGRVITDFGSAWGWCNSVAIQAGGKILAAGYSENRIGKSDFRFAVVRYTTNGIPDPEFNGNGRVISSFGPNSQACSVAMQKDGRILVGGTANDHFALARYNSDGTLDSSFGAAGTGLTSKTVGSWDKWTRIAVQPNGKILVVGPTSKRNSVRLVVARYNADGSSDPSFGTSGADGTVVGAEGTIPTCLAFQPDGKLLVAGSVPSTNNWYRKFALVRYDNDAVEPPEIRCPSQMVVDCDTAAEVNILIHNPSGLALTAIWSLNGQLVQTNALPATNAMTDMHLSFIAVLPQGTNNVAITVTDTYANSSSCSTSVIVVDRSPPLILSAEATPNVLWPPNHKFVSVSINAVAIDNCDPSPVVRITRVTSNQPQIPFWPDWEITGPLSLNLRAERSPHLGARIYTVFVEAIDASGNKTPGTITVTVPQSHKRGGL